MIWSKYSVYIDYYLGPVVAILTLPNISVTIFIEAKRWSS